MATGEDSKEAVLASGSDSGSESEDQPTPTVVSVLDRLRAPKLSDLSRKRNVAVNPPRGKRSCKSTNVSTAAATVTPQQCVTEFSGEQLTVSNGKLFCKACREELNLKKSNVKNHVQSTKHLDSKLQVKQKHEQDIAQQLQKHNAEVHQRGESLPLDQRVYRVTVVRSFLRAAVPLNKLDCFRDLLEENAYHLSDRRHMSDLVPFILKEEQCRIRKEIADKHVAVIFDGTTRLGEALAIVLRFVSDDWTLEQRLVRMQLLAKILKGEEIARELIHVLSTDYSIGSSSLLAAMRDWASSNGVAMRTLAIVYPKLLDVGCFSHTIDHVGERFHTPTLSEFGMAWVSLFAHSPKTRMLWREQTGQSMPTYSATRWWSGGADGRSTNSYWCSLETWSHSCSVMKTLPQPQELSFCHSFLTTRENQLSKLS